MADYKIITDSSVDLSLEVIQDLELEVVPFTGSIKGDIFNDSPDMSEEDRDLVRLIGNKSRDYDPLELYNLFLTADKAYEGKKKKNQIAWGDGRKVEWLSDYLSISPRTIQKMIEDSWIINSKNLKDVRKSGSYSTYTENKRDSAEKNARVADDNFNKEFKFLDRIQNHHEKIDFEKLNLNDWQFEDLRKNAISTIGAIMQKYGLSKKDL